MNTAPEARAESPDEQPFYVFTPENLSINAVVARINPPEDRLMALEGLPLVAHAIHEPSGGNTADVGRVEVRIADIVHALESAHEEIHAAWWEGVRHALIDTVNRGTDENATVDFLFGHGELAEFDPSETGLNGAPHPEG